MVINLKRVYFLVLILIISFSNFVYASEKENLIYAINKTYYVGGEAYTLPESIKVKGINYLRTHYFTEEQCKEIMGCINEAVVYANELGTTNISKLSESDIKKGLSYVYKAISIAKEAPKIEEKEDTTKNVDTTSEGVSESNFSKATDTFLQDKMESNEKNTLNGETTIQADDIDYSKFISEDQYEEVEFEDFKKTVIKEVKQYSIKKFLPYIGGIIFIFCLIIILFMIKFKKSRNKGGRL